MRNSDVLYGIIPSGELNINERELQRRLGMRADADIDPDTSGFPVVLEKCRKQLLEAAECRFAWCRVPLTFPEEGTCLLGDIRIASRDLCRNLQDCTEAVLMGVTLGLGADRLLFRLEKTAPAEHFITSPLPRRRWNPSATGSTGRSGKKSEKKAPRSSAPGTVPVTGTVPSRCSGRCFSSSAPAAPWESP